jgi:hypothetical protein
LARAPGARHDAAASKAAWSLVYVTGLQLGREVVVTMKPCSTSRLNGREFDRLGLGPRLAVG